MPLATAGTGRAALVAPARAWGLSLVAALLGAWPYAHAWIVTGNPIFPFYNAVFKSPLYPLENFGNIYPGGLSWRDLYDLTFSSSHYLEAWDGALGFVLTLLLPAGLIVVARRGPSELRMAMVAALSYLVVALLSTRYLRYLYPALPWLFLVAVAPLDFFTAKGRMAVAALLALVVGVGIARIPSAGWIIGDFNLPMAFSPRDKEAYADIQVPMRVLGRTQAAIGDRNSKTAIFGAPVGAYVKGRPLYAHWYHPVLGTQVHSVTSVEEAARALAALNVTHVMFDLRAPDADFQLWQEAAAKYGRLVYRVSGRRALRIRRGVGRRRRPAPRRRRPVARLAVGAAAAADGRCARIFAAARTCHQSRHRHLRLARRNAGDACGLARVRREIVGSRADQLARAKRGHRPHGCGTLRMRPVSLARADSCSRPAARALRLCIFRQRWAERGTIVRCPHGRRHRCPSPEPSLNNRRRLESPSSYRASVSRAMSPA